LREILNAIRYMTRTGGDQCVIGNLDPALRWQVAMDRIRDCMATNEGLLGIKASSSPQISVGAAVTDLRVFRSVAYCRSPLCQAADSSLTLIDGNAALSARGLLRAIGLA